MGKITCKISELAQAFVKKKKKGSHLKLDEQNQLEAGLKFTILQHSDPYLGQNIFEHPDSITIFTF